MVWEKVPFLQAVAFKHSSKHYKSRQIVAFALLSVAMCLSSHSDSLQRDAVGAMRECKKVGALVCWLVSIGFSCTLSCNLKSSQTEQQHPTSRTYITEEGLEIQDLETQNPGEGQGASLRVFLRTREEGEKNA